MVGTSCHGGLRSRERGVAGHYDLVGTLSIEQRESLHDIGRRLVFDDVVPVNIIEVDKVAGILQTSDLRILARTCEVLC